jgi:hypothetical protein
MGSAELSNIIYFSKNGFLKINLVYWAGLGVDGRIRPQGSTLRVALLLL